ncbi:AraC family transcriptional regulator [Sphingomonas prati]|uniref:AraC family transcriptional activator of pobA n=1 Tax=Sphingomonas prati TaxID=1843237 RepID=A0A7W9BUC2_9SPHN|nr:helix-turn-helix domain-containing protein [Sphingomonas prati]MBB5730275.1 AraC family transcriptional activator of pobA [Sphingomonas prati]GGE92843.1 AraC family transcriptional regulator [Sphingomonas prati]
MAIPFNKLDDPPDLAYRTAVKNALVPSFYLYGEPHRAVAPDFIHVERLDARSRPSEWMIRPHAHADLVQIFFVDRGGGSMLAEGGTLPFTTPALLLVPGGVVHGFQWTRESTGAVVTLACACLDRLVARHPDLAAVFAQVRALQPDADIARTIRAGIDTLDRELGWSATGHHAAVEAGLLALLVGALRAIPARSDAATPDPGQQAALVARFRARIEQRFRLRESVATHAAALGTSDTSLRAACTRIAARPPAAMLDERAMLEARRALLYTNLSIAEVGYALGFADPAYFSRFFTRHAARSPRAFRRDRGA